MPCHVAAIRERLQEAGLPFARLAAEPETPLLAGGVVSGSSVVGAPGGWRQRLHRGGRRCLVALCAVFRWRLATDRLARLRYWLTTVGRATRFFVAGAPVGQTAAADGHAVVGPRRLSPADDALAPAEPSCDAAGAGGRHDLVDSPAQPYPGWPRACNS